MMPRSAVRSQGHNAHLDWNEVSAGAVRHGLVVELPQRFASSLVCAAWFGWGSSCQRLANAPEMVAHVADQDPLDHIPRPPLAAQEFTSPVELLVTEPADEARGGGALVPQLSDHVHARTGFADEFGHISDNAARVADLPISLCAVLIAEACNIELETLARRDIPAHTRGRLLWVQQNYVRAETITRANARLVASHARIWLARMWGGGKVATADGLRLVVPVRTINAAPNPKYFGRAHGATFFNFANDQFAGQGGVVVPGTPKDAPYLLAGLLEQWSGPPPTEIITDCGSYSDQLFGALWLLGYRFSPRLADLGDARLWRLDRTTDYGVLNGLARNRIDRELIARNWDDLRRLAGSLKISTVGALELLSSRQGGGRVSTLGRALNKSWAADPRQCICFSYFDDEEQRRYIGRHLTRHESRHKLARHIFHGRKEQLRQAYREGMEDQLGALGLVVNVLVLWTTLYMDRALAHLRRRGAVVDDDDVARLSPLGTNHIYVLGRYHFFAS